jgi:hypothetical protein
MSKPPKWNVWKGDSSTSSKPPEYLQHLHKGVNQISASSCDQPGDLLSVQDLQKLLHVDSHSMSTALLNALEFGGEISRFSHARIQTALWNALFRDWISPQSTGEMTGILAIEVDKNSGGNAVEPSALTHYAAVLSKWVRTFDDTTSVVFISTRMAKSEGDGPNARTVELLRSLCHQILRYSKIFPESSTLEFKILDPRALEEGDFDHLCHLFTRLIKTLSQLGGTLVCFVDGADVLANDEGEAFHAVLVMFAGLMDEAAKTGGIFGFKALLMFAQPVPNGLMPSNDVLTVTNATVGDGELLLGKKSETLIVQCLNKLLERDA